jgi:hypothetical protein
MAEQYRLGLTRRSVNLLMTTMLKLGIRRAPAP